MLPDPKPQNFWDVAFSPNSQFIGAYLLTLIAMAIIGNLAFTALSDYEQLTSADIFRSLGATIFLLLIAGYIWQQRQVTKIPFSIKESERLERAEVVIAIPSSVGTVGKIVRYHSGVIRQLWLVGDASLDSNYLNCKQQFEGDLLRIYRIKTGDNEAAKNIYEGYKAAIDAALKMNYSLNQIVADTTGGKKPMTISAFLVALEKNVRASYVESNYDQIQGTEEIKRAGEAFAVVKFDIESFPFIINYSQEREVPSQNPQ